MAHGWPLQAIVVACGSDERTVACWLARAGGQGQAVQAHLVEHPRDLGQVHADGLRVTKHGDIVWMALAMTVRTRLWLAHLARSCAVPEAIGLIRVREPSWASKMA